MNITVDTREFYNNLKWLAPISTINAEKNDPIAGRIYLCVDDGLLVIMAGIRSNLVVIQQPLLGEGQGSCCLGFDFLKILKVLRDSILTLSGDKRLSIKGDKGFKGSMSLLIDNPDLYPKVKNIRETLSPNNIIVHTNEISDLAKLSLDMPDFSGSRWVDLNMNDQGTIYGNIQENETGSVDFFPFSEPEYTGEYGVGTLLSFRSSSLLPLLTFSGKRTTLNVPESVMHPMYVADPDNPTWYALTSQIQKPGQKNSA